MLSRPIALGWLLAAAAQAASFKDSFTACKLQVVRTSSDTVLKTHSIEGASQLVAAQPHDVPTLTLDTTLKLSCSFDEASAPRPHQAILLFAADSDSFAVPVRLRKVKGSHALRSEVDFAKAPLDFLALSLAAAPVSYALHVASFDVATPGEQFALPFGSFRLSHGVRATAREEQRALLAKAPREWEAEQFAPQDAQEWTFNPVEVGRGAAVGVVASILVLTPPVGLLGFLLHHVSSSLSFSAPSGQASLFLLCLASLEGLILAYWYKLRIFTFLPLFAVGAVVTSYVGKSVLSRKSATGRA